MYTKVLKYMFLYLLFVILITIVVSHGCTGDGPTQQPTSASSQNTTAPGQQQSSPSDQPPTNQHGGFSRNPDFMKNTLSKVAEKLGVSDNMVNQAYEQARSTFPSRQSPPPQDTQQNSNPGQRQPRSFSSENMTAFFNRMSEVLNIPADKITDAFQQSTNELRNSSNTHQ